jgi:pimeloyl-ACP methyl ester carboxylesterase
MHTNQTTGTVIPASAWFSSGKRVPYNLKTKQVVKNKTGAHSPDTLHIYKSIIKGKSLGANPVWASFLPGWPDGSYGWAKVDHLLADDNIGHRLYFDYVGHGASDKPVDYPYSTFERADMVEAIWKSEGIKSTYIYAFDYSSIVTLELLARQQDRLEAGEKQITKIEGVVLINGGLYADGHTHPLMTTPILKSWFGGFVTSLAQKYKPIFAEITKSLWSKDFHVTQNEIDELYKVIGQRNGIYSMHKSAGFLKDHLQNPERLNLTRLYRNTRGSVAFHIIGSAQDPFEGKQATLAQERLGDEGLDVRIVPGGHLSTSENPECLAQIIKDVAPKAKLSTALETPATSLVGAA